MEMDIFNLWQQLVHDISVYCYFQVACSLCTFHICIPVRGACISYGFSMYFFCCFFFVQFSFHRPIHLFLSVFRAPKPFRLCAPHNKIYKKFMKCDCVCLLLGAHNFYNILLKRFCSRCCVCIVFFLFIPTHSVVDLLFFLFLFSFLFHFVESSMSKGIPSSESYNID